MNPAKLVDIDIVYIKQQQQELQKLYGKKLNNSSIHSLKVQKINILG